MNQVNPPTLARFLARAHGHVRLLILDLALDGAAAAGELAHGRPARIAETFRRGDYTVDVDEPGCPDGSLFTVRRGVEVIGAAVIGAEVIGAGYLHYGAATTLVLAVSGTAHGWTLDPERGEFVLTHPDLRIPTTATELAVDPARSRTWTPAVRRYVEECDGRDFSRRWTGSTVLEARRLLTSGGVLLAPGGGAALAHLVEQAGGAARGDEFFGAAEEVVRFERLHRETSAVPFSSPLYGSRGLFRTPA